MKLTWGIKQSKQNKAQASCAFWVDIDVSESGGNTLVGKVKAAAEEDGFLFLRDEATACLNDTHEHQTAHCHAAGGACCLCVHISDHKLGR